MTGIDALGRCLGCGAPVSPYRDVLLDDAPQRAVVRVTVVRDGKSQDGGLHDRAVYVVHECTPRKETPDARR